MFDKYWQADYLPKDITAFGSKGDNLLIGRQRLPYPVIIKM